MLGIQWREKNPQVKPDLRGSGAKDQEDKLKKTLTRLRDERDEKEAESIIAKGALAALTGS
jgi:hypothetical protein